MKLTGLITDDATGTYSAPRLGLLIATLAAVGIAIYLTISGRDPASVITGAIGSNAAAYGANKISNWGGAITNAVASVKSRFEVDSPE